MKISIVLPIYNEEGNIDELYSELKKVVDQHKYVYEMIAVNDGSKDGSFKKLKSIASLDNNFKVLDFVKNYGQTSAILAGINESSGDIIVLIDSDLENDPEDIPRLIKKLEEGHDVVSGWRKGRWKGSFFTRKLPSVIANWLISKISGLKLHDFGCTLKAYKKEVIKGVALYGEMHRFIPVYAYWHGGQVVELKVNYRMRKYGKSNYGLVRTFNVLLDLVLIKFLDKYMNRPIHFFGGIGFLSFFVGAVAGFSAVVLKIMDIRSFVATPLPVFSALFLIVGVVLVVIGLLAEIAMRTYYESQDKKTYVLKNKINL